MMGGRRGRGAGWGGGCLTKGDEQLRGGVARVWGDRRFNKDEEWARGMLGGWGGTSKRLLEAATACTTLHHTTLHHATPHIEVSCLCMADPVHG